MMPYLLLVSNLNLISYYTWLCIGKLNQLDGDVLEMMQGPQINPLDLDERPTFGCLFLGATLVEEEI